MGFKVPEGGRLTLAKRNYFPNMPDWYFSDSSYGNNGVFLLKYADDVLMFCIVSDMEGWEHVSVSTIQKRCPTWEEMCFVKNTFWGKDDCVVQFHPPESEYVNNHPYCLHLWRQVGVNWTTPPSIFVGI